MANLISTADCGYLSSCLILTHQTETVCFLSPLLMFLLWEDSSDWLSIPKFKNKAETSWDGVRERVHELCRPILAFHLCKGLQSWQLPKFFSPSLSSPHLWATFTTRRLFRSIWTIALRITSASSHYTFTKKAMNAQSLLVSTFATKMWTWTLLVAASLLICEHSVASGSIHPKCNSTRYVLKKEVRVKTEFS